MKEYIETMLSIDRIDLPVRFTKTTVHEIFIPLLQRLTAMQQAAGRRIVVYVGAPISSGKSVLLAYLEQLSRQLPDVKRVQALGMDGFHLPNSYLLSHDVTVEGQTYQMKSIKGWPETFDVEKLYQKLSAIRQGDEVFCPGYDRNLHDPVEDRIHIDADIVLVEGLWMMYGKGPWEKVQSLADYRIMLLARAAVLRERAVARKIRNGMTAEAAAEFFDRSDLQATRRIVTNMMPAQLYLESFADNDIIDLGGAPQDLLPYYQV